MPFGGEEDFRAQSEAITKEANRKSALMFDEAKEKQKIAVGINSTYHLTNEQFDIILKQKIRGGYPITRLSAVVGEIETEKRRAEEQEQQRKIREEAETIERQKFDHQFKKTAGLLNIPLYKKQLENIYETQKPTQTELEKLQEWTLETTQLNEAQKALALSWLQLRSTHNNNIEKESKVGDKIAEFLHLK